MFGLVNREIRDLRRRVYELEHDNQFLETILESALTEARAQGFSGKSERLAWYRTVAIELRRLLEECVDWIVKADGKADDFGRLDFVARAQAVLADKAYIVEGWHIEPVGGSGGGPAADDNVVDIGRARGCIGVAGGGGKTGDRVDEVLRGGAGDGPVAGDSDVKLVARIVALSYEFADSVEAARAGLPAGESATDHLRLIAQSRLAMKAALDAAEAEYARRWGGPDSGA